MGIQATQPRTRPLRLPQLGDPMLTIGRPLRMVVPVVVLILSVWASLVTPPIPGTSKPPHAIIVLSAITLLTVGVTIRLRRGLVLGPRAALALPLPLYPLYLATMALAGTTGAVALAFVASLLSGLPEVVPGIVHTGTRVGRLATGRLHVEGLEIALRHAAAAALTTLVAGTIYASVPLPLRPQLGTLNARLVASILATLIMLAGIAANRLLDGGLAAIGSAAVWRAYLRSPAFGYQLLLLSIGPLLPFVALLDNFRAEVAWILFLIPLYVIYGLAILGVRLRERTDELQRSVEALTASRRREVELAGYAALVTRAQEEERRRLARELHDDTAQTLIALSRGLDTLAARRAGDLALPPRDQQFIDELGALAKRSLESIRRACQNLRPSVLDDLGLAAALESLVASSNSPGTRCTFTQEGATPPACAPEVEVIVYRIAQEALANALRHAHARQVTLHFACWPDALRLRVSDDGCGFDPSPAEAGSPPTPAESSARGLGGASHLGLLGMRERAALIGATLQVHGAPGAGTVVELHVPLPA